MNIVAFLLERLRHGVRLSEVERAVPAAFVTPLGDCPDAVLGVIDVGGAVLPVLSLRRRLGLPPDRLSIDTHFLLARMGARRAMLAVDEVTGVEEVDDPFDPAAIVPGLERYEGIARTCDGLLLIHDLERFFSPSEWRRTERAMADAGR